jgi:hypothetical protein
MHHNDTTDGPNPSGLCMCGCGQKTRLARQDRPDRGDVRGKPVRYVLGHAAQKRERLCRSCNRVLPSDAFDAQRRKSNGAKQGNHVRCRECRAEFIKMRAQIASEKERLEPYPCACGCGELIQPDKKTTRGFPRRFVPGHQMAYAVGKSPRPRYVIDPDTGCWVWQRSLNYGYGSLSDGGRTRPAHRWYWEQKYGPIPDGHELHHRCENPACVNPDHLEPMTPVKHRRVSKGTLLTEDVVREIKETVGVITGMEWARRLGVNNSTISNIRCGRTWRDVA